MVVTVAIWRCGTRSPSRMPSDTGANGPIPILTSDIDMTGKESFFDKEAKFARRWLLSKGVLMDRARTYMKGLISIEQTAMQVSSASRITSYSISCQPTRHFSTMT